MPSTISSPGVSVKPTRLWKSMDVTFQAPVSASTFVLPRSRVTRANRLYISVPRPLPRWSGRTPA